MLFHPKKLCKKIKDVFVHYEQTIITLVAIILVGVSSYAYGIAKGMTVKQPPLKITTHDLSEIKAFVTEQSIAETQSATSKEITTNNEREDCLYVGSIHGKKYYPPRCKSVKRIRPENLTCFRSVEDATQRGYTKTTTCTY